MKKLKGLLILVLGLLLPYAQAASVPYEWVSGEEHINVGQPNQAGTASLEKDGKTVTLKLNNYNGTGLQLVCYGTGQSDMVFIIELEGENYITASDVGIDISSKVTFTGNGSLSIKAPKPLAYESFTGSALIIPSQNIYREGTEVEEAAEEITINNNEDNQEADSAYEPETKTEVEEEKGETSNALDKTKEKDKDKGSFLIPIVFGVLIGVLLSILTFTFVVLKKKNK